MKKIFRDYSFDEVNPVLSIMEMNSGDDFLSESLFRFAGISFIRFDAFFTILTWYYQNIYRKNLEIRNSMLAG